MVKRKEGRESSQLSKGEVRVLHLREIVADAIELDCGIIVMGSRGRGDLAGLVM